MSPLNDRSYFTNLPSSHRTANYILIGAGAVGIAAGVAAFGVAALGLTVPAVAGVSKALIGFGSAELMKYGALSALAGFVMVDGSRNALRQLRDVLKRPSYRSRINDSENGL